MRTVLLNLSIQNVQIIPKLEIPTRNDRFLRKQAVKKQGEFGSVKSAVVAHVWLNDNSMKIRLIASGIFAVSLDRGGNKLTMGVKQCQVILYVVQCCVTKCVPPPEKPNNSAFSVQKGAVFAGVLIDSNNQSVLRQRK